MLNREYILLMEARQRQRDLERAAQRDALVAELAGVSRWQSILGRVRAFLARPQPAAPELPGRLSTTTTRAVTSAGR